MHTARITGSLFITATIAGVLSAVLLDAQRPAAGGVMVLVMAGAIAMIAPTLFPVLKEHGEASALAYVVARTLEVVLVLPAAIGPLVLAAEPGSPVQALTRTYDRWGYGSSALFFCLSVVLLNRLLYRSRLVPRWISGWALVAVVPYLADACLGLFGVTTPLHAALVVPLAVNEMVLAIWLVAKGFNSVVAAPQSRGPARSAEMPLPGRP